MGARQSSANEREHEIRVVEDKEVFKAQNEDAQDTKEVVACQVTWRLGEVSGTVGLDDELGGLAVEVDDERAESLLASEPKHLLGWGL
jgi:hypothetical protein